MKQYEVVNLTGDKYLNPAWSGHSRNLGSITSISVHHNAIQRPHDYDSVALYRNEAASHYRSLGQGLQYHWCIDNIGTRFKIRPHEMWLHVVGSAENTSTLAICLDGNMENQQPTREQLESLYQLLLELCTKTPAIPAVWKDVRPHADFSPTACCGANLRNRIYAIQDEASAKAQLLNQGTFDWPELQPSAPVTPSTPIPTPPSIEIKFRVMKDGKQVGAYTIDTNAWNKYKSTPGSRIMASSGGDVTEELRLKFEPPAPPKHDDHADIHKRLSALEAAVKSIQDFLSNLFKGR